MPEVLHESDIEEISRPIKANLAALDISEYRLALHRDVVEYWADTLSIVVEFAHAEDLAMYRLRYLT